MRKRLALFISGITAATLLCLAPTAGAEPTITCPDGFVPVPASLVEQGEKKDRNGNGFVCSKVEDDAKFVGGPDDRLTDDILL